MVILERADGAGCNGMTRSCTATGLTLSGYFPGFGFLGGGHYPRLFVRGGPDITHSGNLECEQYETSCGIYGIIKSYYIGSRTMSRTSSQILRYI